MSQINDCKFTALRGQGFTGSLNDMLVQWLAANTLISRYFRRNLGTIDYAEFDSDIVLASDFSVELDVLLNNGVSGVLFGNLSTSVGFLLVFSNGLIRYRDSGSVDIDSNIGAFVFDQLNKVSLKKTSGTVEILVNGVVVASGASSATLTINSIYKYSAGLNVSGILANLKISSAGTPIHSLAIDDDSNTLVDSIGGNNATVINGLVRDWSYFTEQNNGEWLGQELVVNGGFDTDSDWVKGTGWSIAGGAAIGVSIDSFDKTLVQPDVMSVGILYSISLDGTVDTGELVIANASQSPINGETGITPSVTSFETTWLSDSADVFIKRNININNATVTKVSVKEVLNVA